jgi:hypothetical protein
VEVVITGIIPYDVYSLSSSYPYDDLTENMEKVLFAAAVLKRTIEDGRADEMPRERIIER